MKISETILFVTNLDQAQAFLEATGLVLKERQSWGWALFEDPTTGQKVGTLLKSTWGETNSFAPRLAFESADLEADLAVLELAGASIGPIQGMGSVTRSATFHDPDGNAYFIWQSAK